MINSILAVTICAPDLRAVEEAYSRYLHYRVAARGRVSARLAALWQAPRSYGRDFILLQPASNEPVFLRFVQAEPLPGYAPMKTYGWNAIEILVKDPDALAVALADSPFKIIGAPRGLSTNESIRAMQVIGPANELLYLTSMPPDEAVFNLGSARTEIDRVFIVVLGGHDLAAMRRFYAGLLHLPVTPPAPVRVSVLSQAYGMGAEHLHQLALALLPAKFLIELDEYPTASPRRPQRPDELPPGVATVSFNVTALGDFAIAAIIVPDAPYYGRRVTLLKGAAGEMIELVAEV